MSGGEPTYGAGTRGLKELAINIRSGVTKAYCTFDKEIVSITSRPNGRGELLWEGEEEGAIEILLAALGVKVRAP